jgi:Domain of unknown function (DUF4372)/Transposase DDE domain
MNKSSFFTGQPIFSQLLNIIPRHFIGRITKEHKGDYYCKRFKTYDHLVTLLYTIFNNCNSLREVTTGMLACEQRLSHLGLNYYPRRSTIADANKRRSAEIFESIYLRLLKEYEHILPDSREKKKFSKLYIFDSTVISLFKEVLGGTGLPASNGKRKGGIKVHTLISSDQDVPCLVRFSSARANDSAFLKYIQLPKGSVLVFDRGYNDYTTYNRLSNENVTWITRLRTRAVFEVTENKFVSSLQKQSGVISDQLVILGHDHKKSSIKVKARLITYFDAITNKCFDFITNDFRKAASSIAGLYKKRWQIELLFKRMKQNYPLKYFLGESENAIKIQIWCTLIADLLLKIVKRGNASRLSFSNLSSMVRLHLMTYIKLSSFLRSPEKSLLQMIKKRSPGGFSSLLFPQ